MSTIKLSIIIPVYNVEKYIRKCMSSCLEQEGVNVGEDYEIIVVNDGTPDKSMDIVKQLVGYYNGVTITNQTNQGLSVARNNGLSLAKGTYVWFIDSDDWIEKDSVSTILSKISAQEPDIIKIRGYQADDKNQIFLWHKNYDEDVVKKGAEAWSCDIVTTPAQYSICKKELLERHNLKFLPHIYHEDNEFTPRLFWYANKVVYINRPLYYHRVNQNSITHIPNPKRAFDLIDVCNSLHEFGLIKEVQNDRLFSSQLNRFISMTLNSGFNVIEKNTNADTINDFNLKIRNNKHLIQHLIKSRSLKYIIEGLLFKISNNFIKSYQYLNRLKL